MLITAGWWVEKCSNGIYYKQATVNWTLLLFYGFELLTPSAHFVHSVSTVHVTGESGGKEPKSEICFLFFCCFHNGRDRRCRGTTKQRLMVTWTSWRRPQGWTWTIRTRMAWLPPYWLPFTDMSMLFSSYAAEGEHFSLITCDSSHIT